MQIVDVLVNATQRALNGKLKESGWNEIGSLIPRLSGSPLQMIAIKPDKKANENIRTFKAPYYSIVEKFNSKAKSLFRDDEK